MLVASAKEIAKREAFVLDALESKCTAIVDRAIEDRDPRPPAETPPLELDAVMQVVHRFAEDVAPENEGR
jgi:hypothetical protein